MGTLNAILLELVQVLINTFKKLFIQLRRNHVIMSSSTHQLVLKISTPKVADEGKNFTIEYRIKNIGSNPFPAGGQIQVEVSWEKSIHKVYQQIATTKVLNPEEETELIKRSQEPLTRDYTWFYVNNVISSDGKPIQLFKEDETTVLWPHITQKVGNQILVSKQALHAVRTRTSEEKGRALTQWLTVAALIAVITLQVIDWILQYLSG